MLLIYPPTAKPSEPPAGIAQLAGCLKAHNHSSKAVDLNIEGLLYLLRQNISGDDNWSKRAIKNRERNLAAIRSRDLYANPAKYEKCVLELNRILEIQGSKKLAASLANYQDLDLSPLKSNDLLLIAEQPERSLFYHFFCQRLEKILVDLSPQHIGISLTYLSQALSTFALIGVIRRLSPEVKIIVGGGLMTSWMNNGRWTEPFAGLIDHCIAGPGEIPLLALLGKKKPSSCISEFAPLIKNSYLSPGFILPYNSSTGCFWNKCSFCPEKAEGSSFSQKAPEKVIKDLSLLTQKNKPVLLHFLDNAVPPAVLRKLSSQPPGVPWYGFARISHHLLDLDFCRALRRSGCLMLKLGVESGHQDVLDTMQKGIELAQVSKVLQNLKAADIATYIYLLFGTPSETYEEALATLRFTKDHCREISFLNLAIFNMPVNSQEKYRVETSTFYTGDLSLYTDFTHPSGWNRKKVRAFLDREFKRQPEIARIIQHDPPHFTSNHAPFFRSVPPS